MARAKIEDLPKDMKIGKEEMKKVLGGVAYIPEKQGPYPEGSAAARREELEEWMDSIRERDAARTPPEIPEILDIWV